MQSIHKSLSMLCIPGCQNVQYLYQIKNNRITVIYIQADLTLASEVQKMQQKTELKKDNQNKSNDILRLLHTSK